MDDVGGHGHDLDGGPERWSLYMSSYVDVAHVRDCLFDNDHNVLLMAEMLLERLHGTHDDMMVDCMRRRMLWST